MALPKTFGINAHDIFNSNPLRRKSLIEDATRKVNQNDIPEISEDLLSAYKYAVVINSFIRDYFKLKVKNFQSILQKDNLKNAIKAEIARFLPEVIEEMNQSIPTDKSLLENSKNIYEISAVKRLSFSNKITRTLSTKMGSLWERLAHISPYAINPELEFGGLKITGIDSLVWNKGQGFVEYHQIKTQENTLTGSQKIRSVSELLIHDHPVFSTCFKTAANWTFPKHPQILRLSGKEFWDRIDIDYEILLICIKEMMQELENRYVELLNDQNKWQNPQGEIFEE